MDTTQLMPRKLMVIRQVTTLECPWLVAHTPYSIEPGEIVWTYEEHTFGCVSDTGIAVTRQPGVRPFFELPRDAVTRVFAVSEEH